MLFFVLTFHKVRKLVFTGRKVYTWYFPNIVLQRFFKPLHQTIYTSLGLKCWKTTLDEKVYSILTCCHLMLKDETSASRWLELSESIYIMRIYYYKLTGETGYSIWTHYSYIFALHMSVRLYNPSTLLHVLAILTISL